ncbi:MAG: methyltransferase domain-containing protein [Cyclobacteriaceae bacterium]
MKYLIAFIVRFVPRKYLQRVSGLGLRLLGIFYAGNAVTCPICQHHYRRFLPYGRINPRPNALCPSCQSLERHRLIWVYLQQETSFFASKQSVLHVAPEACFMAAFEKQHGDQYITADIESPLAKVKMDIHQMPFTDGQFDVVLCNHVLEHVTDDIQAMKEIARVLRPGGYAILQVPFFSPVPEVTHEDPTIVDPRERERVFGQDDHVRLYGRDYPARIQRAGLKPEPSQIASTFAGGNRYGLSLGEVLYIARKS